MAFLMAVEPGIYASLNSLSFPGLLWKFSPSKSLKIPTYTRPHHTCLSFSPCIRALLPVTKCRGKRDLFLHTEQSSGTRWVGILYSSSQFWKPLELTPTTWCLEGCSISLPFYNSGVHQIQCSSPCSSFSLYGWFQDPPLKLQCLMRWLTGFRKPWINYVACRLTRKVQPCWRVPGPCSHALSVHHLLQISACSPPKSSQNHILVRRLHYRVMIDQITGHWSSITGPFPGVRLKFFCPQITLLVLP